MAKAVVDIILPGNYGGDTLANLLSGDENFSGKLPFTYPKEINSLINYDYKVSEEVEKWKGLRLMTRLYPCNGLLGTD